MGPRNFVGTFYFLGHTKALEPFYFEYPNLGRILAFR